MKIDKGERPAQNMKEKAERLRAYVYIHLYISIVERVSRFSLYTVQCRAAART